MENYYEILDVSTIATTEQIKTAWREKIKELHADKNNSSPAAEFATKLINNAYETLSDHNKRREYDLKHGIKQRPQEIKIVEKVVEKVIYKDRTVPVNNSTGDMLFGVAAGALGVALLKAFFDDEE